MSDSSDVEIIDVSERLENVGNKSKEDLEYTNSSDDYDEDPTVSGMKAIKLAKSELERERRNQLNRLFDFLQQVVSNDQKSIGETWKRKKTVDRAVDLCHGLTAEGDKSKLELEILIHQNWMLKQKLAMLTNKKKRKSSSATLARKVSNLSLSSTILQDPVINKMTMDDPPLKIETPTENHVKPLTPEVKSEDKKCLDLVNKQLKRRYKKRTGLSEEEREFHALKDKIEDLLCEVDAFWNEVKDDDEEEEEEETKGILGILKGAEKENLILDLSGNDANNEKIESVPQDVSVDAVSSNLSNSVSSHSPPQKNENTRFISVTDIKKLMAPQFVNQNHKEVQSFSMNTDDSTDDECPRLVIDEGDSPMNSDQDVNILESLKAVDTLCQSIVDDANTSNRNIHSVNARRPVTRNNSKLLSDDSLSDSSVILLD